MLRKREKALVICGILDIQDRQLSAALSVSQDGADALGAG